MTTRPLRADAARNRAAIIDAARVLLVADGPEVGMDEIAARAGVAVGTLYRHFPAKHDLVAAVAKDLSATIVESLDAVMARIADGRGTAVTELLALIGRVVVDLGDERLLRDALSDLAPEPLQDMRAQARAAVERMIDQAHREHGLRPDITVDDVVLLLATAPGAETPLPSRVRWLELAERALSDPAGT